MVNITSELPDECLERILERVTAEVLPSMPLSVLVEYSAAEHLARMTWDGESAVVEFLAVTREGIATVARFDPSSVGLSVDAAGQARYEPR